MAFWNRKKTTRKITLTVDIDAVVDVHLARGGAGGGPDRDRMIIHCDDAPATIVVRKPAQHVPAPKTDT